MNFTRVSLLKIHGVFGRDGWHLASNIQELLYMIPENNCVDIIILPSIAVTEEHGKSVSTFHALVVERITGRGTNDE